MTRGSLLASLGVCAALTLAVRLEGGEGEPDDVLIEVRFREPVSTKGPPPSPPWAEDPGAPIPIPGILLPEVREGPGGNSVVFQTVLYPTNERQLAGLANRHFCPFVGPDLEPRFENRSSCVVGVHSNPRLVREARRSSSCPRPVGGGNIHGLRRSLDADAAARIGGGAGVLIVVVDVPLNAAHVERWQGVKFDPHYSFTNDGVPKGMGPVKSHGTMAAYLATVLAPKATLASISTSPFEKDRLDGAIKGLTHVVDRFLSAPECDRYGGVVVNNSWAVADESRSYLRSTVLCGPGLVTRDVILSVAHCHAFSRLVRALSSSPLRFDFVFAAGNRGQCELAEDEGSIRGPARLDVVTTVAAVDTTRRRLFDSGQGGVETRKPDVSAYAHYNASGTIKMDTQTSAATAVTSGLVAAVRSCLGRRASPAEVRRAVTGAVTRDVRRASSGNTAPVTSLLTHDREFGSGVILPVQALSRVCPTPTP